MLSFPENLDHFRPLNRAAGLIYLSIVKMSSIGRENAFAVVVLDSAPGS